MRSARTSLLINCSKREAQQTRANAEIQRRTVSGYVINIVMRSVNLTEKILPTLSSPPLFGVQRKKSSKSLGPRTTLHIYCSADEAKRIRTAAKLRSISISGFVLYCLHRSWKSENVLREIQDREARPTKFAS